MADHGRAHAVRIPLGSTIEMALRTGLVIVVVWGCLLRAAFPRPR